MTIHPRSERLKPLLFFELLDSGHWIASRGMLALSLPVTDELTAGFAAAFEEILSRHAALFEQC
jgi:glutamate-1-semialdehyde 2,1-aminomutase